MSGELSPIDKAKFVAAKRSVDYVEDGMRVGAARTYHGGSHRLA